MVMISIKIWDKEGMGEKVELVKVYGCDNCIVYGEDKKGEKYYRRFYDSGSGWIRLEEVEWNMKGSK